MRGAYATPSKKKTWKISWHLKFDEVNVYKTFTFVVNE